MNKTFFKISLVNILVFAVLIFGLSYGFIQQFFLNDASHITYIIAALMAYNVVISFWEAWGYKNTYWVHHWLNLTRDNYFGYLGLMGTIYGFSQVVVSIIGAIKGVQAQDAIQSVLNQFASGASTAFLTTLVGVAAFIWTGQLLYFLEDKIRN